MFSGIVENRGKVIHIEMIAGCKKFTILSDNVFNDLVIGDSISVNGVCLTITSFGNSHFNVTTVPETLRLTNLKNLSIGSKVNLERSLTLNKRIGGHYVQGHVDGTGDILDIASDNNSEALLVKISLPEHLSRYVVPKGYIILDGMSITVIAVASTWFTITFIPHTQEATIVNHYQVGDIINIEVDIMGKYIEKLLGAYAHASRN